MTTFVSIASYLKQTFLSHNWFDVSCLADVFIISDIILVHLLSLVEVVWLFPSLNANSKRLGIFTWNLGPVSKSEVSVVCDLFYYFSAFFRRSFFQLFLQDLIETKYIFLVFVLILYFKVWANDCFVKETYFGKHLVK